MKKITLPLSNDFCPQSLFLYGTYGADGKPDFGQFCWVSYYWGEELGVMAAICEDKLTRDNIRAAGRFSMGLVTEDLLPYADYFGCKPGYEGDKMSLPLSIEKGRVLDVPVLEACRFSFELEVEKTLRSDGDGEIYLCRIRNALGEEFLADGALTDEEKLKRLRPVHYACNCYYSWDGRFLGTPGEPMKRIIGERGE